MSDLIERQAAIDEIEERKSANGYRNVAVISELNRLEGYIMGLPSAQPEIVRCKDCKWWKLSEYNTFGIHVCKKFSGVRGEHDFCSRAERKGEQDG